MSQLATTAAHRLFQRRALAAGLIAAAGAPLLAQADFAALSGEVAVNATTVGYVMQPQVAVGPFGDSIVVFQGGSQFAPDIYIRRFDAAGNARAAASVVNTVTSGAQRSPAVARSSNGASIVVWEGPSSDGQGIDIWGQRYDAAGAKLGNQLRLNRYTTGDQRQPKVAMDGNGGFVVTFLGPGPAGVPHVGAVHARHFNANGAPLSDDFMACTTGAFAVADQDLSMNAKGNFAVVCSDRKHSAAGGGDVAFTLFAPKSVSPSASNGVGYGAQPAIAIAANGSAIVTWAGYADDENPTTGQTSIRARRFDAAAVPLSSNVRVNAYDYDAQFEPSIAIDAKGDYLISWSTPWQDGDGAAVYGQRYSSGGLAKGGEFRINQTTAGDQMGSRVGVDADGDLVMVWEDRPINAISGARIMARRYRGDAMANLSATLAANRSSAAAGQTVSFTATLSNVMSPQAPTGNAAIDSAIHSALNARITLAMPTHGTLTTVPTLDRPGTCTPSGSVYVCTLTTPLPAGQVAKASYAFTPNGGGDLLATATSATDSYDQYTPNNTQSLTISVLRP